MIRIVWHSSWLIAKRVLLPVYLLVEVEDVDCAFFVGDLDIAKVLLKRHVYHLFRNAALKLVCIDVDLDFCLFVAPGELRDFRLSRSGSRWSLSRSLVS